MKHQKNKFYAIISVLLVVVTVFSTVAFSAFSTSAVTEPEANVTATADESVTATDDETEAQTEYNYELRIKTGDVKYGGTSSTIYFYPYNDKGELIGYGKILFVNTYQNLMDTVKITLSEKMETFKIALRYQEHFGLTNSYKSWYLDYIDVLRMEDSKIIEATRYGYDMWLSPGTNGETLFYSPNTSEALKDKDFKFQLTVKTGDYAYGETLADVLVEITNYDGETFVENLSVLRAFSRGNNPTFDLTLNYSFSQIKSIKFYLDSFKSDAWYFESFEYKTADENLSGVYINQTVCQWIEGDYKYVYTPNGIDAEKENYLLNIKTGNVAYAGTDARVEMKLTFTDDTVKTINLNELYPNDNAFEKGQDKTLGFSLDATDSKVKSVNIYLAGSGKDTAGNDWYFEKFTLTKTTGKNIGSIANEKVCQWIMGDTSYFWCANGVKSVTDNYLLDIKVGGVTRGGTDDDVRLTVLFSDGTNCDLSLSEIYPYDNAFEKGQQVTIGFSLPAKDCEIKAINFYSDKNGIFYDDWYLESFKFVRNSGAYKGECIERTSANIWIGDDLASVIYSKA